MGQEYRTDPSVGRSRVRESGTSGHAAAHYALRPERRRPQAGLHSRGLMGERPVHASSMAESTTDDHLTVDGDADPEHAACSCTSLSCPARHGACPQRPAPRLAQGHRCRPWGHHASALAGRRLTAATAGLREASELVAHSGAIYIKVYTHVTSAVSADYG